MADGFEDQGWVRLGVAAALSREYASDSKRFLELLAKMLSEAMPEETEVRTKGLFKKSVSGVVVDLGGSRLSIEDTGRGPLAAWRAQVVRGIVLKNESASVEEVLAEVEAALETRAAENARARKALADALGLD